MKQLNINPVFRDLIQSLTADEFKQLEDNVLAEGIRDAIVVWNDTIVDGHNRYQLAQKHSLQFDLHEVNFNSQDEAVLWIIDNQLGRRNLTDFVKLELQQKRADVLYERGKSIKSEVAINRGFAGNQHTKVDDLSIIDKTSRTEPAHNTQKEIAESLNWSTGKVAQGQYVIKHAPEEVKEKLRAGELSMNEAYKAIKTRNKEQEIEHKKQREQDELNEVSTIHEFDVQDGDVWILGRHTLICGNIHKYDLPDAHAIITDPPYGIDYQPEWKKWDGSPVGFTAIEGDQNEFDPRDFMLFDTMVFFGANYYTRHLPIGGWICWDKRTKDELDDMFGSPFELAWFRTKNTTKTSIMIRVLHGGVVNADSVYGNNATRLHPTQKPVILFEEIMRKLTKTGEIVFDPFCGSGTTLLAAENTGRTCIAFEIEPKYCNIILSRFKELTNIEPCKE